MKLPLKATWTIRPNTRQLHGLACAVFEGESAEHLGQDKPFAVRPLEPAPGRSAGEWIWRCAWLPDAPLRAVPVTFASTAYFVQNGTHIVAADPRLHRLLAPPLERLAPAGYPWPSTTTGGEISAMPSA